MVPASHSTTQSAERPASLGGDSAATQHGPWRSRARLASFALVLEHFLLRAGPTLAPWLAVGMAAGVAGWFALADQAQWICLIILCLLAAGASAWTMRRGGDILCLPRAVLTLSLSVALGCGLVWGKSALVGTPAIPGPLVLDMRAIVLERQELTAQSRVRLVVALRLPGEDRAIKARISLKYNDLAVNAGEGAIVRLRARLFPPAPPRLPGGYDFARAAWFDGLAATGSALGPVQVESQGTPSGLAPWRHALAAHVRAAVPGSAGGMAAAFASGERGGITPQDEAAMRDAGLTHLLSVSGLHVSAVVAATYFLALRLLGLWPWLVLRVRLPVLAGGIGGLAAVGYTLLTGAEVPTVRSCLGALLALAAMAAGRRPFSVRLLALAAGFVMLLWPEAVVGPSFQMSFGSVLAIVALHEAAPVRAFLARRQEGWWIRMGRDLAMLLLTGLVIELALMPVAFFHFHRAGIYGSLANLLAIPLTTFVSMPLIGAGLLFDLIGAGRPFWHLCGWSLDLLLGLARWVAARPDVVAQLPVMGSTAYVCMVLGMLWLALWRGQIRLLGLIPAVAGCLWLAMLSPPDMVITGDGRQLGLIDPQSRQLLILGQGRSTYARSSMQDAMGASGEAIPIEQWRGAQCNDSFCRITITQGGRNWRILAARGGGMVEEKAMATACGYVDIVVSRVALMPSCRPRLLRADEPLLYRTGGMALYLAQGRIVTVAQSQGQHPWWRAPGLKPREEADALPPAIPLDQ
ncbi:ComEC/Rec2 family competence protein [Novosphingobium sp. KACC 22771]|uniref:ComEC/Rec2 family competence protein n=1 Tax=Novosphingobium sp. KACC 22771 TaxID=3025670 RepID=UPI003FD45807